VGIHKFLLSVIAIIIVLLVVTAWFYPVNDDFAVENPLWNGIRNISEVHEIQPLNSLSNLPAIATGATLVLIPYSEFTEEELGEVYRFVMDGGRLILADDYGYGNQVLEPMDIDTRFSGQVLIDPLIYHSNQYFPVISHFATDPLTVDTENLVLNHATGLINVPDDNIIASSSSFSFLDLNDNGERDDNEPAESLPVISRCELGDGEVILLSDPSLFINIMGQLQDNRCFIKNITAPGDSLYIDQSHLSLSELHYSKDLLRRALDAMKNPAVTAGLLAIALVLALIPIWHRKKKHAQSNP